MAKIIAICGKICSGKSFYARQLKERESAVILSCDEMTKVLFDNDLGDKHDEMSVRIHRYLKDKAAEIALAGCTVILDWGFWSAEDRKVMTEFCRAKAVACEWHYVHVDDAVWDKNITERNGRVLEGKGGCDYYLDEGLKQKCLAKWEAPAEGEMDVIYRVNR